MGKETGETAHVERWNCTLRQRLVRFVRETLSFSKIMPMHVICLDQFLHRYNLDRAILRQYRTEDFEQSGLLATYPFNEDALRLLIANLSVRTPHEINQHCAYVIEEALKQGVIHDAGEGNIDTQFVRNVEDQRLKSDMR